MSYESHIFHLCLRRVAAASAIGLFALSGVEDPKHGRGTQHFDEGFAKYGKPGDTLQRRIELYLLDCGVTEKEIADFRSIMLEQPLVSVISLNRALKGP